ncbi:MAG: Fic family protein [Candidatus Taylorbacteria bacterium]|nr:Fic family protein [Candidatus Taylorbacteria bacterium]
MDFKQKLDQIHTLKAEIDAIGRIDPAQLKNIDDWYRIEMTYTSNALEDNTLTRQETAQVVEKDISVEGKSLRELIEAKNHAAAIDHIMDMVRTDQFKAISLRKIIDIHSILLQKIDDANAGKLRTVPVRIAGSTAIMPNPVKVPELMDEFIEWLATNASADPVTCAIECHFRFVSIHPFTDGNGRTARLVMNAVLAVNGYPPLIIPKESRREYVTSLEKGQNRSTGIEQEKGDTDDYFDFMYTKMIESMEEYLRMVKGK